MRQACHYGRVSGGEGASMARALVFLAYVAVSLVREASL